jgi:hypothetical protein
MTTAAPLTLDLEDDFSVTDDMQEDLGEATGILVVEQSIYRRFQMPRGTLPSPTDPPDPRDVDAGTDLLGWIGLGNTPAGVLALQSAMKSEVGKEAGVDIETVVVDAQIDVSTIPVTATIAITGQCLLGPFALTIGVSAFSSSQGTITLLSTGGSQ